MQLPAAAGREVQVLSDLAGTGAVGGVQDYITGYPLKDFGAFVVAKTWPAPEVDRPGSAWTHSLLIPNGALPFLKSPEQLQELFSRPTDSNSLKGYSVPLTLRAASSVKGSAEVPLEKAFLRRLVHLLYSSEEPVLVPLDLHSNMQDLILRIWLQQWPALRRTFSFNTATTFPRAIDGKVMDLQVIVGPGHTNVREWFSLEPGLDKSVAWLQLLLADLSRPDEQFRTGIARYAADLVSRRTLFPLLVELYSLLSSRPWGTGVAEELVNRASVSFAQADQALSLKKAIVGGGTAEDELAVLEALATLNAFPSFARFENELPDRIARLVNIDSAAILRILLALRPKRPRIFEMALNSIGVNPMFVQKAMTSAPEIAMQLVAREPSILITLTGQQQLGAETETLLDQTYPAWAGDDTASAAIARHLMEHQRFDLATRFVQGASSVFVQSLLEALESIAPTVGTQEVAESIYNSSAVQVVDWIARAPGLALPQVRTFLSRIPVRSIASSPSFNVPSWASRDVIRERHDQLVAVACGFIRCSTEAGGLVATHIASVYKRLLDMEYDWQQWQQLRDVLPTMHSLDLESWDRGRAVRCAILLLPATCSTSASTVLDALPEGLRGEIAETFYELRKKKSMATLLDEVWSPIFGKKSPKKGWFW